MKSFRRYEHACRRCGAVFETFNVRRLYCSDACRRSYQDERRKAERVEERERRTRWLASLPCSSAGVVRPCHGMASASGDADPLFDPYAAGYGAVVWEDSRPASDR